MTSERDQFQEIADQILREDPRFYQRASRISASERKSRAQLRRVGAILSMVAGFPVMVISIAIELPVLGLLAFCAMLAGTLPAARDLSTSFRIPTWKKGEDHDGQLGE
jgi:hypothetical protein